MNKGLAWIVIILLALLLAIQGYELYGDLQAAQQRKAIALAAMDLAAEQRTIILSVMDEYQKAAYSDDVDRIAEQQLIATEHQLVLLQILAIQNGSITELLAGIE